MPRFSLVVAIVSAVAAPLRRNSPLPRPTLDYDFFKARVQPVFTTKRAGNARGVSCHDSGTPMRLQKLPLGSATWSEEDSRKTSSREVASETRQPGYQQAAETSAGRERGAIRITTAAALDDQAGSGMADAGRVGEGATLKDWLQPAQRPHHPDQ